jgi:GNAT superfamily N-acetyltransferase
MTIVTAGTEVTYTVNYLEMDKHPTFGWPHASAGMDGALLRAVAPPSWYFLALYDAVGQDYDWTDKHQIPTDELTAWLHDPKVAIYTLMQHGWPQGFFMLDWREDGECALAYFGLVPEAIGQGLGTWLLRTAILTGWAQVGVKKMTLNTCSLDHPRALATYQKQGFNVVGQAQNTRVLVHDRDTSRFPI